MHTFNPRMKVSSAELAEVFGVTERRIQQLEDELVFRDVGNGRSKRYVLVDAIQAWLRKSEIEAARQAQGASTGREQYEIERTRKLRNENDAREAQLIETREAIAGVDAIAALVTSAIAEVPARFSSDPAVQEKVSAALAPVLAEIANRQERAIPALREGRDPLEPDDVN